jgi:hypothetical protein
LRVFRDYGDEPTKTEAMTTPPTTPQKRKIGEVDGSTEVGLPLTPPATVKSEIVSLDLEISTDAIGKKVTEHFVRRSARRIITDTLDSPTRKA